MTTLSASISITSRGDCPNTFYYVLHCHWCDQPRDQEHLPFCRRGRKIDWTLLRQYVLARDNWTCRYCDWIPAHDGELYLLHADHVRPRSDGGRDVPWNLVTACWRCNGSKGASIPQWLTRWESARADYEAATEAAYHADRGAYA